MKTINTILLLKNLFITTKDCNGFCKVCIETFYNFAPIKPKYTRINQMLLVTKEHSKEILTRSRLRNNFLTSRTKEIRVLYTKEETNACLFQEMLKKYYGNLDEKKVTDNKQFWKTIKPLISNKSVSRDGINLLEKGEIVKSKPEILNKFFSSIVKNLTFQFTTILIQL